MEYVLAEIPLILGSPFHLDSIWNGDGMAKFHMEWWNVHVDSICNNFYYSTWNPYGIILFIIIKKKYINIGSSTQLCILVSALGQVTWPFHTPTRLLHSHQSLSLTITPPLPPPTTRNSTTRVLPCHPAPPPQPMMCENMATTQQRAKWRRGHARGGRGHRGSKKLGVQGAPAFFLYFFYLLTIHYSSPTCRTRKTRHTVAFFVFSGSPAPALVPSSPTQKHAHVGMFFVLGCFPTLSCTLTTPRTQKTRKTHVFFVFSSSPAPALVPLQPSLALSPPPGHKKHTRRCQAKSLFGNKS